MVRQFQKKNLGKQNRRRKKEGERSSETREDKRRSP